MPKMKLFRPPAKHQHDVKSFAMRRLLQADKVEMGVMAKNNADKALGDEGLAGQEVIEAIRLSLVQVDGVRVNDKGIPFMKMDGWDSVTMRYVQEAFSDLNGVEDKDLGNFLSEADDLDDDLNPIPKTSTSETTPGASDPPSNTGDGD